MSKLKGLIIPFLLGGFVISGVKFAATSLNNPALSAIFGGLPTGLIAIYFITSQDSIGYAHNYFYVTLSLLTAIIVFYLLQIHTKMRKDIILLIALLTWVTLVGLNYMFNRNNVDIK